MRYPAAHSAHHEEQTDQAEKRRRLRPRISGVLEDGGKTGNHSRETERRSAERNCHDPEGTGPNRQPESRVGPGLTRPGRRLVLLRRGFGRLARSILQTQDQDRNPHQENERGDSVKAGAPVEVIHEGGDIGRQEQSRQSASRKQYAEGHAPLAFEPSGHVPRQRDRGGAHAKDGCDRPGGVEARQPAAARADERHAQAIAHRAPDHQGPGAVAIAQPAEERRHARGGHRGHRKAQGHLGARPAESFPQWDGKNTQKVNRHGAETEHLADQGRAQRPPAAAKLAPGAVRAHRRDISGWEPSPCRVLAGVSARRRDRGLSSGKEAMRGPAPAAPRTAIAESDSCRSDRRRNRKSGG